MKLYELTGEYLKLAEIIETPEDETALADSLKALQGKIEDKVEGIGKLLLSLDAEQETIAAEIKRLSTRSSVIGNHRDGLKNYLLTEMITLGVDKFKNPLFTVSVRTNPPSVNVLDKELIPAQFRRIIPETWEVDKRTIIENFKTTGEIPEGTEIIKDKKSLVIK